MTEPTVNIPLLRKAVEWAEAEAAKPWELCEWNQVTWEAEAKSVGSYDAEADKWVYGRKSPECGTCYCIAGFITSSQGLSTDEGWHDAAAAALGLTYFESGPLFDANNTIEDVRRIAEDIAGERL